MVLFVLGVPPRVLALVTGPDGLLSPVPRQVRLQATAKLDAAGKLRQQGELGLALEEARQSQALWPENPAVQRFMAEVSPQATATVAEAARLERVTAATATAAARATAAVETATAVSAAATATQIARNPPLAVVSQNVRRVEDRVHILGEIRNDSPSTVFWRVDAFLDDDAGNTVASGVFEADGVYGSRNSWRWAAPPLAPGDVQPYWVTIAGAPPFTKVRVSAKGTSYAAEYPRLLAIPPTLTVSATKTAGATLVRGSVTNDTPDPLEAHVLVWFVNKTGQVVEAHDQRLLNPTPLFPGVSSLFEERAAAGEIADAKWVVWGTPPPR